MPVFQEHPAQLSKGRLKADLVAHNVTLPVESSRKDVYVDLHLKHVASKNAADFSSDEEDHVVDDAEEAEPIGADMPDLSGLTDDDLRAMLAKHGVRAGPILASTRALYERRLQKILKKYEPKETSMNGTGDAYAYSDSEEEEEEGEEEEEEEGDKEVEEEEEEESDSEVSREEAGSHVEQAPEADQQRTTAPAPRQPCSVRNMGTSTCSAVEEPTGPGPAVMERDTTFLSSGLRTDGEMWSESDGEGDCSQVPMLEVPRREPYTPTTDDSTFHTPSALSYQQSVKECLADGPTRCYLKAVPIRAGITATCRKPIKGAAGRPVRYRYPDAVAPPASPLTLQRREVERRLAPVYVQVLVFLAMAALLYLAYACTEEEEEDEDEEGGDDTYSNPLLPLLDGLSNIMESVVGGGGDGEGEGLPLGPAHPGDLADSVDLVAQDSN